MQGAILSVKLRHLEKWTQARQRHAKAYSDALQNSGFQLPEVPAHSTHVFHLYVVQVDNRDAVQQKLKERGISAEIHYPMALPFIKAYQSMGHKPSEFPVAHRQTSRILSLPIYPELTSEMIQYITGNLKEVAGVKRS